MLRICLFFSLLSLIFVSKSQSVSNNVISSSGESYSESQYYLDYSVGEIVVETISNQSFILTQGFQQGNLDVSEITNKNNIIINIFPNPVTNKIIINFKQFFDYKFALILSDINGNLIIERDLHHNNFEIDFSNYPIGVYNIRIFDNEGIKKSFKILKI